MEEKVISRLMETGDGRLHRNLSPAKLVELALERGEGTLASNGALVTRTGERSGRSPKDRFIVEDKWAKKRVAWGGVNRPVSPEVFDRLLEKAGEYLSSRDRFVFEGYVGADPQYRMTVCGNPFYSSPAGGEGQAEAGVHGDRCHGSQDRSSGVRDSLRDLCGDIL
jgi:ATP-dependent phosphoenolpyruvate carboxykinase